MADDPEEQARRDELAVGLATIDAIRAGKWAGESSELSRARAELLASSVPPPQPPPAHDAHVYDRTRAQAAEAEAARAAEYNSSMATINRMRFDHARREGQHPFTVVRNEGPD